jgi:hypothetical protein
MSKAINWPKWLYDEIINEDSENIRTALRLGTIYFDNGYYVDGEIVDIRVDNKVVRKAVIVGNMHTSQIRDLSREVIGMYKDSLKLKSEIISFLSTNYNKPVDDQTLVTVITYRNLPVGTLDESDDPHMN